MSQHNAKNLLIALSGGIAAYKCAELVSLCVKAGFNVRVTMTKNATRFVGALTFEALSGHPVLVDTFDGAADGAIDHIEWAKWPDIVCVAPATANMLAKLACGLADDAPSTVLMALPRGIPCLIAPAMNTEMGLHPVVQRNVDCLKALDRYHIVQPVSKRLACGDVGPGGLADPAVLLKAIQMLSNTKDTASDHAAR